MKHLFLSGDDNLAKKPEIRQKISLSKKKYATAMCPNCLTYNPTTPYKLKTYKNIFCNRVCKGQYTSKQTGSAAPNWKGGVIVESGYIKILSPSHPNATNGYVLEHRLVMERYLGRYLADDEVIHHLDQNKKNNQLSNLILTNRAEHLRKYHPEITLKANNVTRKAERA